MAELIIPNTFVEGEDASAEQVNENNDAIKAAFETSVSPFTWYQPKITVTEESRENTNYGKLATPDEITEVVLPNSGLILIGYSARIKASAAEQAGSVAIFLNSVSFGSNQLKRASDAGENPSTVATTTSSVANLFTHISTASSGFARGTVKYAGDVTTGQILGHGESGGPMFVYANAGTYSVSVQFKASSGTVTAKERKLWVATLA